MKNSIKIFFLLLFLVYSTVELFSQDVSYVYGWYKYYEPVEEKIVGIWPPGGIWNDIQLVKELKYRWGFNYILFWSGLGIDKFNMAEQVGYLPLLSIMRIVEPDNYLDVTEYDECWGYFLDEPADRPIPFSIVQNVKEYIKTNFPNAPFIISGYKRNSDLINYTNLLADKVLFSSYKHWVHLYGDIWIPTTNPDQRSDWTDMKNLFENKFSTTWVSANDDLSEYNRLLSHAQNLGLDGIWLYHYSPGLVDEDNVNSFCNAAVNSGFLRANYQQVRDRYVDGVFASRQFVGRSYSSIPFVYDNSDRLFTNVTVTNNRIDDYFASNSIKAGSPYVYLVPASKKSSFNSNNEIILQPGFHAQRGSEFRAYITKEP
jgi:hypothetical protein